MEHDAEDPTYEPPQIEERSPVGLPLIGIPASGTGPLAN
jgi:hypothetical protein